MPARAARRAASRPLPDVLRVVLPARQLPAGLPHAPGRSLGKRCRPVVLPVKIGPTLPAVVLPTCCVPAVADVLPVVLPAGHVAGKRAGPVVLPGQDRPHAPGPWCCPTCCAAGRLPTCCPVNSSLSAQHGAVAAP